MKSTTQQPAAAKPVKATTNAKFAQAKVASATLDPAPFSKTKSAKTVAASSKATAVKATATAVKATAAKTKTAQSVNAEAAAELKAKRSSPQKKVRATKPLTPEQQKVRRKQAARKAALARWSKERPLSQKARKQQLSRVPTSELTVEHYADRPNPELSWAAAILKRQLSGQRQRQKAAEIMSRFGVPNSSGKLAAYWKSLTPEQRHEIAQRAGRRRWEIWREERARLEGESGSGK
ncbi:MAG: hypothetical protein JWN98_800 [Abditibacteriota bacterium]|nr:hypothetical protein [Abditibacteriota bacterium]